MLSKLTGRAQNIQRIAGEFSRRRGRNDILQNDPKDHFEKEKVHVSNAAQKFNKIGQRINHWICDTEVMGDLDNGSVNTTMKR